MAYGITRTGDTGTVVHQGRIPVKGLLGKPDGPGIRRAIFHGTEGVVALSVHPQIFHDFPAHLTVHQAHVLHIVRQDLLLSLLTEDRMKWVNVKLLADFLLPDRFADLLRTPVRKKRIRI